MPAAIPLVGAAFSIGAGVTAAGGMAALAAGGLSALTLTSGLMIAGGALTGIGALTGNKKLMTLGSVMGLAGGVSNFLSKAGETAASAAGAEVASQAAAEAGASTTTNIGGEVVQGAAADAARSAADVASDVAGSSALAARSPEAYAQALGPGASAAPGSQAAMLADQTPGFGRMGLSGTADAAAGANPMSLVGPSQAAPAGMGMDYLQAADQSAGLIPAGEQGAAFSTTLTPDQMATAGFKDAAGQSDWWSRMKQFGSEAGKWIEKNPTTAKLGGGLVAGAMSYLGQNQLAEDQVKRQMAYQDWVRQRYSDSVRNLTVPSVVRTAPQTAGIIGGARG